MRWFQLHPKVKALGLWIAVANLGLLTGALNGTTTWHESLLAGATATIGFVVAYLKSISPDA